MAQQLQPPVNEVVLAHYGDIQEVLASPDFVPDNTHPRTPLFAGSILTLSDAAHRARRRAEVALVARSAIRAYPPIELGPALGWAIESGEAERGGAHDQVRVDLVPMLRRMTYGFAARVTGIDLDDDPWSIDRFIALQEQMSRAGGVDYGSPDAAAVVAEALALRDVFAAEYLAPSIERRTASARGVGNPDLLTLLVAAEMVDDSLAEAVLYFLAATGTTARVIPHAVTEIEGWQRRTGADPSVLSDPGFLAAAGDEALRLRPSTPAIFRRCRADHVVASGQRVGTGELVVLDVQAANRDPEVWGPDAGEFDPHRVAPAGLRPWGLAFGGGPHQCLGQPAASASREGGSSRSAGDGLVARLLHSLYAAGVRTDPERAARQLFIGHYRAYETFPVLVHLSTAGPATAAGAAE
jgi:cytochrome P450